MTVFSSEFQKQKKSHKRFLVLSVGMLNHKNVVEFCLPVLVVICCARIHPFLLCYGSSIIDFYYFKL